MKVSIHSLVLVICVFVVSGCLKKKEEVQSAMLSNLCQLHSNASPSCAIFGTYSSCSAVYGSSCTEVSLVDNASGMVALCSGYPLVANGCSTPVVVGQTTGGTTGGNSGNCTGQPVISAQDPSLLNFGKHFVGTPDWVRTIAIKNSGSGSCPAVLGTIAVSSSADFDVVPIAGGCASGTSLAPNSTCSIGVRMKSLSAGSKSASLQVPFSFGGQTQSPASLAMTSIILSDSVVFNPGLTTNAPILWAFSPTVFLSGQSSSTRCSFGNSTQEIFFRSLGISSSEQIEFKANLTNVNPMLAIKYYGKQVIAGQWDNFNFTDANATQPVVQLIGATEVKVYFKNTSGLLQSVTSPSEATANLSYRPTAGPDDAPFKVRTQLLRTYCY